MHYYGSCQLFAGRWMMFVGLTLCFGPTWSYFAVFVNSLLVPASSASTSYIYIWWCLICFMYARYWVYACSVILNTITGCIPVVSNNLLSMICACNPRAPIPHLHFQGFCYYLVFVLLEACFKIPCFSSTAFKLLYHDSTCIFFWSHSVVNPLYKINGLLGD